MRLDPYLTPSTKVNSKWINDLSAKAKTIKVLGKIGIIFCDLELGHSFLGMTPNAQGVKEK